MYNHSSTHLKSLLFMSDDTEYIAVSIFVVDSDTLFQISGDQVMLPTTTSAATTEFVVSSPVVSVTIEGANITDLIDPVVFTFSIYKVDIQLMLLYHVMKLLQVIPHSGNDEKV